MLYFLQALLSPPVLGALAIFVLPWGIAALIDRRLDRTRRISGLPPVRIHAKTFLAVGYLLAFLGFIVFSVIPSLLDFTAKDKLLAANYAAKDVALMISFASTKAPSTRKPNSWETFRKKAIGSRPAQAGHPHS